MAETSKKTLRDIVVDSGSISYQYVITIISNTLESLKEYHSTGRIYGAIQAQNIFVYPEEKYRVELRKDIEASVLPEDLTGLDLESLLGLSPEHFHSKHPLDHRSDLYGLGYIAYYLLTAQDNPYGISSAADLANRIGQSSLPDPRFVQPELPEWLALMVMKLTAPEPSQRYQSVFSVIRNIAAGQEIESTPAEPVRTPETASTMPLAPTAPIAPGDQNFNPYKPVSKEEPLKAAKGIIIKGLFIGLGVVVVVIIALVMMFKGMKKPDADTDDYADESGQTSSSMDSFVLVKAGSFIMGSEIGNESDEAPVHTVEVSDFYISKYEVSQAQFEKLMGYNPSKYQGDNLPVSNVTWYQTVEYCNALSQKNGLQSCYNQAGMNYSCNFGANGYRLPTEAEWEYAARGGIESRNYLYSGSNQIDEVAWYENNSAMMIKEVGSLRPNELGMYNMSGNLWEWCWDWYAEDYYRNSPRIDPKGASVGREKVFRGGSVYDKGSWCRVANRGFNTPDYEKTLVNKGFRLVRSKI